MKRTARCVLAAVLLLSLAAAGGADVVILRNGDRIEGEIVDETPAEVAIRRAFRGGKIRYIDKIKRSNIARIEKTDNRTAPASSRPTITPPTATRPGQTASKKAILSADERHQILTTALARWKKHDYAVAGAYLSRLINSSPREQLPELSAEIERKLDVSLADLAAEAHLRAAIENTKGHGVRLQFVTEYEKPALIPRLIDAYEDALTQESRVKPSRHRGPPRKARSKTRRGRPPATRPADRLDEGNAPAAERPNRSEPGRAYAIADYLDRPREFDGNKEDARAFARQIRYAMGLLAERMRLDAEIKQSRTLRADLMGDKKRLLTLHKAVLARAGGAMTPQEQQAQQAEIRQWQEQFRKATQQEQQRQQSHLRKAIRMAQEQERQKLQGAPE